MADIDLCLVGLFGTLVYDVPLILFNQAVPVEDIFGFLLCIPALVFIFLFLYPILYWNSDLYKEG